MGSAMVPMAQIMWGFLMDNLYQKTIAFTVKFTIIEPNNFLKKEGMPNDYYPF